MRTLLVICAILCRLPSYGQYLSVEVTDSIQTEARDHLRGFEGNYPDSLSLLEQVGNIQNDLYARGYLLSEAELLVRDSLAMLRITAGPVIYKSRVLLKLPKGFAIPTQPDRKKAGEILSPKALEKIIIYNLGYLENNGYPFAQVSISDYSFQNDTLNATLHIGTGPEVTIDSVAIKGYDRFSRNLLRYDLGIKKGMLYNEALLGELQARTQQIEYLNMTRSPAVAFTESKTILYLYFEEVKGNQVDGVVGVNTDDEGNVSFNGDFQLRLLNILKRGEELQIRWRRPDENVQSLDLLTEIPYLFKTPLWMEGSLNIFRQDSSFVNTSVEALLKYLLESGSFVSGGLSYRSSNVLLDAGENIPGISGFNSFNTTFYKLGLELRKTNRAIVPTAGFRLLSYGMTGTRQSGDDNQDQYGWVFKAAQFIPVSARHIIKLDMQSEALFGNQLFRNELFRIGGLRTLRGFNEQSIYSSAYGIGTLEYRYMIGEYDYLTAFADVAYSETKILQEATFNVFMGIGTGINFRTGAGIFSLFYAIGRDNENPFDFRTSKVHFGYINRF